MSSDLSGCAEHQTRSVVSAPPTCHDFCLLLYTDNLFFYKSPTSTLFVCLTGVSVLHTPQGSRTTYLLRNVGDIKPYVDKHYSQNEIAH